ncbi:MAG: HIT family protein [Sphaerochaetaceae bacterium]
METIFSKIIAGSIPSTRLYEDGICIAILDIAPVIKGHALIITREPYATIAECPEAILGHLMGVAKRLDGRMREVLGAEATNIIINNGPAAGQEVPHLHIHVIPRYAKDNKRFFPPKDQYSPGEMAALGVKLHM